MELHSRPGKEETTVIERNLKYPAIVSTDQITPPIDQIGALDSRASVCSATLLLLFLAFVCTLRDILMFWTQNLDCHGTGATAPEIFAT